MASLFPEITSAALSAASPELSQSRVAYEPERFLFEGGWIVKARLGRAQAALDLAIANVESARFEASGASLIAPSTGVVLGWTSESNELVSSGQEILTIAETSNSFNFRALASAGNVEHLKVCDSSLISFSNANDPLRGRLVGIGTRVAPDSGHINVEISLRPSEPFYGKFEIRCFASNWGF